MLWIDVEDKNIETFIRDYKGDLYGKYIEVQFLKRLRDIQKFDSLDELKKQLERDKKSADVLSDTNNKKDLF